MTRGASEEAVYALTTLPLVAKLLGILCRDLLQFLGMLTAGLTGRRPLDGATGRLQLGLLEVPIGHYSGNGMLKKCRWETS